MIVNSLRCHVPETVHDHDLRACVARKKAPQSLRSRSTSPTSPTARSINPPREALLLARRGVS
jgi:hypothetical protein